MDRVTALNYLEANKDYLFPSKKYSEAEIEEALVNAPDSFENYLGGLSFRKPSTAQKLAIFLGVFGIDRFYTGSILMGIIEIYTAALGGILWIADMFTAKKRCCDYNCKILMKAIQDPSVVSKMQENDAKVRKAGAIAGVVAKEALKSGISVGKSTQNFLEL